MPDTEERHITGKMRIDEYAVSADEKGRLNPAFYIPQLGRVSSRQPSESKNGASPWLYCSKLRQPNRVIHKQLSVVAFQFIRFTIYMNQQRQRQL